MDFQLSPIQKKWSAWDVREAERIPAGKNERNYATNTEIRGGKDIC